LEGKSIIELVAALGWPLLALFVCLYLRREIKTLLNKVESAKLPGGTEFAFGKTLADQFSGCRSSTAPKPSIDSVDWTKVANLYWLSHDVMWTIDALLREAPGKTISHGLTQAFHHLKELGLEHSDLGKTLKRLCEDAELLLAAEWTPKLRIKFAIDLRRVSDQFGRIAESHQSNFDAGPNICV
jgi:hypothetical protein